MSAPLRIRLRPSRLVRVMMLALLLAAAAAWHVSALSDAGLLMLPMLGWCSFRAVSRHLPAELVFRGDCGTAEWVGDGQARVVEAVALHERGPMGVLVLSDAGRCHRLVWGADTLPPETRRALRIRMRDHVARDAAARLAPSSSDTTTSAG